jgi:H+/Cl- antiporter ClcA
MIRQEFLTGTTFSIKASLWKTPKSLTPRLPGGRMGGMEKTNASAAWILWIALTALLALAAAAFLYYTFAATERGGGPFSDNLPNDPASDQ